MKKVLIILSLAVSITANAQCWSQIANGLYHTLAIKTDGTLWAWGRNNKGQLGDLTTTDKNVPTQIGIATNWSKITARQYHSLAIKTDGTLWAWGDNSTGAVGDGTNTDKNVPTQIGIATNWNKITAGRYHSLATKTDGTLWAWGDNFYGTLGDGTNTDKNVPTQIGTATNWSKITAGDGYNHAIRTDGTLWAWGANGGSLGDGTNTNKNAPAQIGSATPFSENFTTASPPSLPAGWSTNDANFWHTVTSNSNAGGITPELRWLYYSNTNGAWNANLPVINASSNTNLTLSFKSMIDNYDATTYPFTLSLQSSPDNLNWTTQWTLSPTGTANVAATTISPINLNSLAGNSTVYLRFQFTGSAYGCDAWYIDDIEVTCSSNNWSKISDGGGHALAIKTDGSLWTWGQNNYGQIGDGTYINKNVPVQIGNATNWDKIEAGYNHSLAIKTDGTLWAWGDGGYGQLGDGTFFGKWIPVQIVTATNLSQITAMGSNTTFAIKTDGTLWAWGWNVYGNLGDGTNFGKNLPQNISSNGCLITSVIEENNLENSIAIYPNPANDHITINYGNFAAMNEYTIKITNALGQVVFTSPINQQISYLDLSTWGGNGIYFIQIINPQNNTIENRKIVLQ
ncbi:MAG: T9SS type A sorting domain-containing protein [Bacteroidia bacterium]|nr:T9SS type A sorting domain-containing protein [Bacteroidia bacterium]